MVSRVLTGSAIKQWEENLGLVKKERSIRSSLLVVAAVRRKASMSLCEGNHGIWSCRKFQGMDVWKGGALQKLDVCVFAA